MPQSDRQSILVTGLVVAAGLGGVCADAQAQLTPSGYMTWGSQNLITKTLDSGKELRYNTVCGLSIDEDHDCLWDEQEFELANRFAPYLILDEGEQCGPNTGWGPQVRFQVRPIARDPNYPVKDWEPNDGQMKEIRIVYYMNWPLDCGNGYKHIGRHLGDTEKFFYTLKTIDMNEFVLISSTHNYHHDVSTRLGLTTRSNADNTSFDRAIIAPGGNKHSSWWGRGLGHNDCAGSEDNHVDDCFGGTWQSDAQDYLTVIGGGSAPNPYYANVYPIVLSQVHNIGEPVDDTQLPDSNGYPEGMRFLEDHTGGIMRSELFDPSDPAQGRRYYELVPAPLDGSREYWARPPTNYQRFCGFLCRPGDQRHSNGDCDRDNVDIHPGYSESFDDSIYADGCSDGLEGKLDKTVTHIGWPANPSTTQSIVVAPSCGAKNCESRNYSNMSECQCDEACHHFNDCCGDKVAVCGDFDPQSCEDKCGRRWTDRSQTCSCSYDCTARGDCCNDASTFCAVEISTPPAYSCINRCGERTNQTYTCACDHLCTSRGDCCGDKWEACPLDGSVVVGSCQGSCGPTPGSAYGGLCFCDSGCTDRGDCCLDAGALCDVQANGSNIPIAPGSNVDEQFCIHQPAVCRALQSTHPLSLPSFQ